MILAACEILHSPFDAIDAMDVETLVDLLDVWDKLHDTVKQKGKAQRQVYIDKIL